MYSLLLLFPTVTVWTTCFKFAKYLQNSMETIDSTQDTINQENIPVAVNWSVVYSAYDSIRKLCRHINKAFGTLYAAYLASCIIAQAAGIDAMLITPDKIMKAKLIYSLGVSILVYVLAADACDKVKFKLDVLMIKYYFESHAKVNMKLCNIGL